VRGSQKCGPLAFLCEEGPASWEVSVSDLRSTCKTSAENGHDRAWPSNNRQKLAFMHWRDALCRVRTGSTGILPVLPVPVTEPSPAAHRDGSPAAHGASKGGRATFSERAAACRRPMPYRIRPSQVGADIPVCDPFERIDLFDLFDSFDFIDFRPCVLPSLRHPREREWLTQGPKDSRTQVSSFEFQVSLSPCLLRGYSAQ